MNVPINTSAANAGDERDNPLGPENTPYDVLGGDARVRELVDAFYDIMDERYGTLRDTHVKGLTLARERLYEFLSGWLGGPQLFVEKHGHPRLRKRHAHVVVDEKSVSDWIACMGEAMDAMGIEGDLRGFLDSRFSHTAHFMQNA